MAAHHQEGRPRPFRAAALSIAAALGLLAVAPAAADASSSPASSSPASSSPASATPATTTAVPANPSAGCALATPATPGGSVQLLDAGGDVGGYLRELPSSYSGRVPMPVVVDLHGYDVTAVEQDRLTQLDSYGDSHGFITITPQVAGTVPLWRDGSNSKDVAFIGGVLSNVDATLCVDRNRVFVTGYSNGAFMASVIGCVDAGQVAAIAPVAGLVNPAHCHPGRAVPVVAFHGTGDEFVSYDGGLGSAASALPLPQGSTGTISQVLGSNTPSSNGGPSIPQNAAAWAKRDGCGRNPSTRSVASGVTLISYSCPGGASVELYRVAGGGHTWPGSAFAAKTKDLGYTTMAISADKIMWSFFQAHPLQH
jgi:polyhydroxybutyrate depolymerase